MTNLILPVKILERLEAVKETVEEGSRIKDDGDYPEDFGYDPWDILEEYAQCMLSFTQWVQSVLEGKAS